MYKIQFCDNQHESINTSGVTIDCHNFTKKLNYHPGDRHTYFLRVFKHPVRVGRLPTQSKNFIKYLRYVLMYVLMCKNNLLCDV